MSIYGTIKWRKFNWIGHILRRNCLLTSYWKEKNKGREDKEEDVRSYWNGIKETRRYCKLKDEAIDRTLWRTGWGSGQYSVANAWKWITQRATNCEWPSRSPNRMTTHARPKLWLLSPYTSAGLLYRGQFGEPTAHATGGQIDILRGRLRVRSYKVRAGRGFVSCGSRKEYSKIDRHFPLPALPLAIIPLTTNWSYYKKSLNPLITKRRLLYLKTQFVPRSKHFSSRL